MTEHKITHLSYKGRSIKFSHYDASAFSIGIMRVAWHFLHDGGEYASQGFLDEASAKADVIDLIDDPVGYQARAEKAESEAISREVDRREAAFNDGLSGSTEYQELVASTAETLKLEPERIEPFLRDAYRLGRGADD